jgi:hypothetical protein
MILTFKIKSLDFDKLLNDPIMGKYSKAKNNYHPFLKFQFNNALSDGSEHYIKLSLFDLKNREKDTITMYKLETKVKALHKEPIALLLISLYLPKTDEYKEPCPILQSTNEIFIDSQLLKEPIKVVKICDGFTSYGNLELEICGFDTTTFEKEYKEHFGETKTLFTSQEAYVELMKKHKELISDYVSTYSNNGRHTRHSYIPHPFGTYTQTNRSLFPNEILINNTPGKKIANCEFWENALNLAMVFMEDDVIFKNLLEHKLLSPQKTYTHTDIYTIFDTMEFKSTVLSHMITIVTNNMRYVTDYSLNYDETKGKFYWTETDNFNDMSELSGNCPDMSSFTCYIFQAFREFDRAEFETRKLTPLIELHKIAQHYEACIAYCLLEGNIFERNESNQDLITKKNRRKYESYLKHSKKTLDRFTIVNPETIEKSTDIFHATCLLVNKHHLLNSIISPDGNQCQLDSETTLGIYRLLEIEVHEGRNGKHKKTNGNFAKLKPIISLETTLLVDPVVWDDQIIAELNKTDGNNKALNEKIKHCFCVERVTQTKKHPILKEFYYLVTNLFIDNRYMYPVNLPILAFESIKTESTEWLGICFDELLTCKFSPYYAFEQKTFEASISILKQMSTTMPLRMALYSNDVDCGLNKTQICKSSFSIFNTFLLNKGTYNILLVDNESQKKEEIKRFQIVALLESDFSKLKYKVDYLYFEKFNFLSGKVVIYVLWS